MNPQVGGLMAAFSREVGQVVAVINPETQRAIYSDVTVAELKRRHPDLELETGPRAVEIVEELHITAPEEISHEQYEQALNAHRPRERVGTTFLARPLICGSVGTYYTCLASRYFRMQQRISTPLEEAWRAFDRATQAAEDVYTEEEPMQGDASSTLAAEGIEQRTAA